MLFNDELAHPKVLAYRNVQKPLNLGNLNCAARHPVVLVKQC